MRVNAPVIVLVVAALTVLAGCSGPFGGSEHVENPVRTCGELETGYEVDLDFAPRVHFNTTNGSFEVAIFQQQVPLTAGNFLSLAQDGAYDETRFHRLEPGEFIQGGDQSTRSEDRRRWGAVPPSYSIPDEHHQYLRHDEAGMLTTALSRPNGAATQFMITLRPAPFLDDRASVFGRVIEGLDTVRELARTPTDDRNRPLFNGELHDVTIEGFPEHPDEANVELSSFGFDCFQVAEPGGQAEYLVTVRNTGQRLANATFETDLPDAWDASLRRTDASAYPLPAGQSKALVIDVDVPEDAEIGEVQSFTATFSDQFTGTNTTLDLELKVDELGRRPAQGDTVHLESVGVLEDGRIFDTTLGVYGQEPSLTWFDITPQDGVPAGPITDPPVEELSFTLGESQLRVTGLLNATGRAKLGQSVVEPVSPGEAYGAETWSDNNLGGKLLIFQLEVVSVDEG